MEHLEFLWKITILHLPSGFLSGSCEATFCLFVLFCLFPLPLPPRFQVISSESLTGKCGELGLEVMGSQG